MMLLIAGAFLSTLIVLVVRGLRDQARVLRAWQMVLPPWGIEVYHDLEQQLEGDSKLADLVYTKAFNARAAGSTDHAVLVLDVGIGLVGRKSSDMVTLLRGIAETSRMAEAVSPVEALRAGDFRLRELSSLAFVAGILHRFTASTAERFRLRTYVLRQGFRLVPRV